MSGAGVEKQWAGVDSRTPYTLWEIEMMAVSYAIRQKPDWRQKRQDPQIRARWKEEALAQSLEKAKRAFDDGDEDHVYRALTEAQADYILDELELHGAATGPVEASCYDGVYESQSLVPAQLLEELLEHVRPLQNVAEKDYHPGSGNQVVDLVHPSLYPFVWGQSAVRLADGTLSTPAGPADWDALVADGKVDTDARQSDTTRRRRYNHYADEEAKHAPARYQWLPADFDVSAAREARLVHDSYINNLHKDDHPALYRVIEGLLSAVLPLFESVLGDLAVLSPPFRHDKNAARSLWPEIPDYDHLMDDEDFDEDEHMERWEDEKVMEVPSPGQFDLEARTKLLAQPYTLAGRRLQVIVKLADIELTPEKPAYPGGVFHVEGVPSEHIIASAIFYYEAINVTPSTLTFRATFDDVYIPYEQNDNRGAHIAYGVEDEQPASITLNSANTTAGKVLCFPNILQHRVSPFQLADQTQPGCRRIVCFFLVDPLVTIPSARFCGPQQSDWVERELQSSVLLKDTPVELWERIRGWSGLMQPKDATRVRDELMKERKSYLDFSGRVIFERPFSLCEH